MKKILALVLALVMCVSAFAMTSCSPDPAKDWENIEKDGKFIVGMTLFEPINYNDENGKLIGFDTEYAQAVAAYLGLEVEFQEIEWGQKYNELNSGAIDCIWNGFTSNSSDEGVARADKVDFAVGYANNYQCVVINKDKISLEGFTLASLQGKTCAVEDGSAGADYAKTLTSEDKIVNKSAQIDAFTELKAGAGDFTNCVKAYDVVDNVELYAIGCRKGSTFTAKINEATKALMNDGENGELSTIEKLSVKYGVPLSAEILALKEAK